MSEVLPKLIAFIFTLAVCAVGLYFQKQERKQEKIVKHEREMEEK
jgi:hypothetical protein